MSAESVGSGSGLYYRYMIYRAWFFEKIIFRLAICGFFTKWPVFFTLEKWKMDFMCDKKENFLPQHCSPCKCPHACIIWAQYHKLCRDSAHNIGRLDRKPWNLEHDRLFCECFFETWSIYQVWYFSFQLCHIIWHHAKDFHCSDFFLNLLCPFWIIWISNYGRTGVHEDRGRASLELALDLWRNHILLV